MVVDADNNCYIMSLRQTFLQYLMMEKDALYVHHKKLIYDALSKRVRKLAHNTWLLVSDANHQPHYQVPAVVRNCRSATSAVANSD